MSRVEGAPAQTAIKTSHPFRRLSNAFGAAPEKVIRPVSRALVALIFLGLMATISSGQEPRKRIAQPQPQYPEIAKHLALTGNVKVQIVVATDGHIKETKVIGGHPVLVEATLKALEKWKYAPANAETTAELEFHFHPGDQ
jgi:TonB family protein